MTDYLSSEEVKYLELSYIAFMRMQNGTATLKCLIVSYRIKHIPSYDQKWKENETYAHKKICAWIIQSSLIIVTQTWKQAKGPSRDERVNKLW